MFFAISCFLPYKHVLSGTATIHITSNKTAILTDSIDLIILLKFERKCTYNLNGQAICLQSPYCNFVGQIRNYSSVRDTLGRQNVLCRFKSTDIKNVENQTVDFRIVCSSENLLQKCLVDNKNPFLSLHFHVKTISYSNIFNIRVQSFGTIVVKQLFINSRTNVGKVLGGKSKQVFYFRQVEFQTY